MILDNVYFYYYFYDYVTSYGSQGKRYKYHIVNVQPAGGLDPEISTGCYRKGRN